MKTILLILIGGFFLTGNSGKMKNRSANNQTQVKQISSPFVKVDSSYFIQSIKPILVNHCNPCHFPGGKMYARLPFDDPQSILTVKEERVLMRIKDEKEKAIVKNYIEQNH